jgi:hypothetical protein
MPKHGHSDTSKAHISDNHEPDEKKFSRENPDKCNYEMTIQILGIFATLVAAFFGAWFATNGADDLWQKQTDIQQKNVAKALKIEIMSIKDNIDYSAKQFHPDLIPYRFTPTPMNFHYYTEHGLYYSFQPEIASFNSNLSTSLFIYYNDL